MQTPAIAGGEPVRAGGEAAWPICDDGVRAAFEGLLQSGDWGRYLGPHGDVLRSRLSEAHDGAEVRLCSGGTAAVWLALVGLNLPADSEVVLAGYDFKANFGNVRSVGARPLLVDVRADDAQLDVSKLDAVTTPATRAIIVSHLHGGSVRMPAVVAWARQHDVRIIEDICQNPLAVVDGRTAGTWGDVAAVSFGGSKTLSAGRGGAVLTRDAAIAARIRRFADRGNDVSPLSEMQAAVLLPQLDRLPERAARRREAAAWLADALAPLGLRALPTRTADGCEPDFYKVGFWWNPDDWPGWTRERFCEAMHAENITLSPGFPALHTTHAKRTFTAGPLPVAEAAGETLLTLHHPILLEGPGGWQQVVDAAARLKAWK